MEDRYANLRPSSRIEEIDENVLRDNGVTDEQINNYQEQIQQQKASVSTTNEQKLEAAGIHPAIIKNVKQIAAIKTAGTWQGSRNIKPNGDHINDPNYIASYNAGRALWLSQQPEDRKTAINRNKKFRFLSEGEDPWDNLDAAPEEDKNIIELAPGDLGGDSAFITGNMIPVSGPDEQEMRDILFRQGWRKDNKSGAQRKLEQEAATTLGKAFKENKARKEVRKLFEEAHIDQLTEQIRQERKQKKQDEEQAGKVITKAAQRYQANKQKKAWVQNAKAELEAEIAKLQEELQAGSREPRQPSSKSKAVNKAMASIQQFWQEDMTQEEARQARRDARQAKQNAQKKTEDNLAAKAKALQDKRKQLEALGK
jgi:chromosome segregation ATPase